MRGILAAVLVAVSVVAADAQNVPEQSVPTIEPRFTRIFGTDSMDIGRAVMSPDGHWVAFVAAKDIWIVPAAGGEPVRLTQGAYHPMHAVWFPDSDRIAFLSDRPGFWAVMTLPIDNETGRPAGVPRQVTLEGSQAFFDVSPDGKWIAYTPNERGNRFIRIVPSTGGTARTVGVTYAPVPMWAPDGQSLYHPFLVARPNEFVLVRVSLDGETTDTVSWGSGYPRPFTFRDTVYVLREVGGNSPVGPTLWDLATLEGRSLARFSLPAGMGPGRFLRDSMAFLSGMGDAVAPIHILPVDGGPARPLTEGRAVDEPLAWLPDGELLFRTALDGEQVLLLAPVGGGPMRQFQLPEDAWWMGESVPWIPDFTPVFSADGRHMLYATGDSVVGPSALKVLRLEDGRTWELSDVFHLTDVTGRGGTDFRDGEEFVYIEKRGDVYELRASPPEGPSRVLWSFGHDVPGQVSVHGDRIVFADHSTEQPQAGVTWLYSARVGQSEARELLRLDGWLGRLAWSPDGRWIAASHYYGDGTETAHVRAKVMFLAVSASGELVGGPRHVGEPMGSYWSNVWLPDSRGIVANGADLNVWLMPVDSGQSSVALTADDPNEVWDFVLSPDGRHIAYSSLTSRGSSLWVVDLSEALKVGN